MNCVDPKCVVLTAHQPGKDCRFNAFDILGAASGLGSKEVQNIWEEVKVNHAKLNGCPGPHRFVLARATPRRFKCELCEGEVDAIAHSWYEKGLQHGSGL